MGNNEFRFFLAHLGGPFWAKKDSGSWGIPKGEVEEGEDYFEAAKREFEEEIGFVPEGDFISLDSIVLKSGKIVHAWAIKGSCNDKLIKSKNFKMEWPPKSGKMAEFPEIDKAEFFTLEQAKEKVCLEQFELLTRLQNIVLVK